MPWFRSVLLVLLAGCADFELAERANSQDQPPKIVSLSAASTGADGGLAGFFGDPLVISGERLDRVMVRIGGTPVRVLETADGGTRLVVEVPDLGRPATSEVEVVAQGSTVFSEKHPLEFLGPGQLRTVRAGTQESLRVPTRSFGNLRVHVPAPCSAPDAGSQPCQDLSAVEEAARQVVLATGSSDYALPLALDFNLASAALEASSTLLAATGLALPFRLPEVSERLFPTVVVALDERGATHFATAALFQIADDSGWLLVGGALQQISLPSTNGRPVSAQLVLQPSATPGSDEVGRLVSLVQFQSADGSVSWGLSSVALYWTPGEGARFDAKPLTSFLRQQGLVVLALDLQIHRLVHVAALDHLRLGELVDQRGELVQFLAHGGLDLRHVHAGTVLLGGGVDPHQHLVGLLVGRDGRVDARGVRVLAHGRLDVVGDALHLFEGGAGGGLGGESVLRLVAVVHELRAHHRQERERAHEHRHGAEGDRLLVVQRPGQDPAVVVVEGVVGAHDGAGEPVLALLLLVPRLDRLHHPRGHHGVEGEGDEERDHDRRRHGESELAEELVTAAAVSFPQECGSARLANYRTRST